VKKKFDYSDEAVDIFSGEILVRAMLKISKKTPFDNLSISGQLSYQACALKFCMPPEDVPVPVNLSIVPPGTAVTHLNKEMFQPEQGPSTSDRQFHGFGVGAGFWLTLLGLFIGGMALNLTPCIYPLIPITVSYFGGMSNQIRGMTIIHGLLYISGLAITNSLLGLTASLTGSMLGVLLQKPIVLMLVSGFLFFLALSFFELWELRLPSGLTRLASKNFGGYFGTFFMGLTLGIVAAPCLGPFMLGLLTYVAKMGEPFLGFLYFFVLSIGMGLPLAVLAIFSGALKKLPLSGGWLMWIRKGFGWGLVGMAAYILQPLIKAPSAETTIIASIIGMAGVHLGFLDRTEGTLPIFPYFKKGVGALLLCIAAVVFWFGFSVTDEKGVQWVAYDPALLSEAAQEKKPVILDFYADWCAPCRKLEKQVFTDPDVLDLSRHFVMIRLDMTKEHPYQDELHRCYQIRGFPTIIFINRDGVTERELRIESFVSRDVVLARMKKLIEE
jgi:thiol:disulfide interchange protein DsbD